MAEPDPLRYGSVAGVRDLLSRGDADQQDTPDPDPADPDDDSDETDDDLVDDDRFEDTAAALTPGTLTRRLATAANQVDSALAPYYAVPFDAEVPGLVVDLTEAIAAYLATLTHLQSADLEKDDPVRLRYEWAVGQLGALARGDVELPGQVRKASPTEGHGSALGPLNPIEGRMFTPASFGLVAGEKGGDGARWDVR